MAAAYASQYNTYVPSFDASGKLVVSYSRNPKDFALNSYVTLQPVKKPSGYYLRVTPEVAARVISTSLQHFVWPDGNDAPSGLWDDESFEFNQFECIRYAFPFRIGYMAEQNADWQILAYHAAIHAQQAMTARTAKTLGALTTSGNWPSSHVATATAQGGGFADTGTPTSPVFKKILNLSAQTIQKDTIGVVRPKDLVIVLDPISADRLGRSQEVHTYLKESPFALAQLRGDVPSQNAAWGLPDQLYGFRIVIDDTVQVTSRKNATLANNYVLGGNTMLILARPGALVGTGAGASGFSTVHLFVYEEMTVESKDDPDHRRISGRVVDNWDVRIVSPVSGFLITNLFS